MNERGQVGLDTAKSIFLALMFIGILGFALIIILSNLNDSTEAQTSSGSITVLNETLTTVTETGENFANSGRPDVSCTVLQVLNATSDTTIPSTNYTQTNCNLAFTTGNSLGINNSNWKVSYTYTYNLFTSAEQNITNATSGFFENSGTWLALLAVVVIILIIAIVIIAVNRFSGRSGAGL